MKKHAISWFSLSLIILSLTACSDFATDGPGFSLVRLDGVALRGPTAPVCLEGDPCEEPFAATFHVYQAGASEPLLSFVTRDDGKFRLNLAPGDYTIVPDASAPISAPELQTKEITIRQGAPDSIELEFNTGIR